MDPKTRLLKTDTLRTYCRGTDAELKSLKQKYRKGPSAVRALLDGFDDQIE